MRYTRTNADTALLDRIALGPAVCTMWQSALYPVVLLLIVRQQSAKTWRRPGQRPLRVISASWNPLRAADEVQRHNIILGPRSETTQYHGASLGRVSVVDPADPGAQKRPAARPA